MYKYRRLWCALIGAGLTALVIPGVFGQDKRPGPSPGQKPPGPAAEQEPIAPELPADASPEEIAEFCITRATEMADRCVEGNGNSADWCVAIVEDLLVAGETEKARHVAIWGIHWIVTHTEKCVRGIRHLSRRCTRAIIQAGGDRELVDQVRAACAEQIERAVESRRQAIGLIKEAIGEELEDPIDPGDE